MNIVRAILNSANDKRDVGLGQGVWSYLVQSLKMHCSDNKISREVQKHVCQPEIVVC